MAYCVLAAFAWFCCISLVCVHGNHHQPYSFKAMPVVLLSMQIALDSAWRS